MPRLINLRPGRAGALLIGALPFLATVVIYLIASHARLADNPNDKMLPAFASFAQSIHQFAAEPDQRTGQMLLWLDTQTSLVRLCLGLAFSAVLGLIFGVITGTLP
jgi:NitT/TauT family transport system permease protein